MTPHGLPGVDDLPEPGNEIAIEIARQTAEHYLPLVTLANNLADGMSNGIAIALLAAVAVAGLRCVSWLWQSP